MERDGPFAAAIRATFEGWADALARCVEDAGVPADHARSRAIRAVSLVQGSLLVARELGTTDPFADALEAMPAELLGN